MSTRVCKMGAVCACMCGEQWVDIWVDRAAIPCWHCILIFLCGAVGMDGVPADFRAHRLMTTS